MAPEARPRAGNSSETRKRAGNSPNARPRDESSHDARDIYQFHSARYDELVRAEDVHSNLTPAIARVARLEGATVVEAGCGTGRVTRLLLEAGARAVHASDREPAMLEHALETLRAHGGRASLHVADGAALAVRSGIADLALAGWVFGHLRHWLPDGWREAIGRALDELERVVRPGGTVVVIETLGTGTREPEAPNDALAEYYAWLESERGFQRVTLHTDYRFDSVDEAARVTGFFFGEAFAGTVRREGWTIVPECTGLWWRLAGGGTTSLPE
jgi:ubiquinone/menaquinone biosynthesis C-methylase UbiE